MEMVHAIDGFLPMRWVEYDHAEVPISMNKYSIHGRNILSTDLKYLWVPCNKYDHAEVPISMNKYSILGRNILSMDLKYPWVPCNTCVTLHAAHYSLG